jgi:IS5 family transposase
MRQSGFFDVEDRLERLSSLGDQLEIYSKVVDFEVFRADLEAALQYSDGSKGGRPPFDPVMMFKILIIQTQNNLSDERVEFLINDRLSFMRFLGLGLYDKVPDARTVWLFREKLTEAAALKTLFDRFDQHLRQRGYLAMSAQIIDASLVAAPRQRMTDEEKKDIKDGRIPLDWKTKIAKLRHKDRDARWTIKQGRKRTSDQLQIAIPHYGYKSHISADRKYKLIRCWRVTDAATHDSPMLPHVLDKTNTASSVWADTGLSLPKE